MDQVNGKWAAYSLDGTSFHKCSKNKNGEAFVKEVLEGPKLNELDTRLKRVEKILDAFLVAGASSE